MPDANKILQGLKEAVRISHCKAWHSRHITRMLAVGDGRVTCKCRKCKVIWTETQVEVEA